MARTPLLVPALLAGVALLAGCGAQQTATLPPPTFGPQGPTPPSAQSTALAAKDIVPGFRNAYKADGVTILVQKHAPAKPHPVLIFFHGWGSLSANLYGPWLAHLVREGYFVIYPEYQVLNQTKPSDVLRTALAGVRSGLELGRFAPGGIDDSSVVVAGHSAGGALAADYAAVAASEHLPPASAVFSYYPGQKPIGGGWTSEVPLADLSKIPASTTIHAFAGTTDATAGETTARKIVAAATAVPATRKQLTIVSTPTLSDHIGPMFFYGAAQKTFWAPLDAVR